MHRSFLFAVTAMAGLAGATAASAAGFYVQDQSVVGLGRAYSGEAADTGADSLWWNPASIAGISKSETFAGLQGELVQGDETNKGSTITRPGQAPAPVGGANSAFKPTESAIVPNSASALRLNDQWSVGLAITSPFSDTTKYAPDSWTRYDGLKTKLVTIDVQPTLAWKPFSWLGVGVGFDAEHVDSSLSSALPNLSPLLPDGRELLKGHGYDYGWVVGAQVKPRSDLTVGLSYRSQIDHTLYGSVNVAGLYGPLAASNGTLSGKSTFDTPWIATIGARWNFAPRWTIDGQVQRFGWSVFNAINVTDIQGATSVPEDYRDTTNAAIGLEYAVTPTWTVRAGAQYDQTPTVDAERSSRVPDGNRWLFGVGTTFKPRSWMAVDVSAGYLDVQKSPINRNATAYAGTLAVTPISVTGETSNSDAILSTGVHFYF
jgi:long-chain fatty acid transport protein